MSNSIWKTPDQKPDEDEKEFNYFSRQVVACHISSYGIEWGVVPVCLYSPTVKIEKWCYLDCLITQADKAERLQKAVDLAVDYLEQVATHAKSEEDNFAAQVIKRKIDEIKQLIKG